MTRIEHLKAQTMSHMVADALFLFDKPSEELSDEQADQWFKDTWRDLALHSLQYADCTIEEMCELIAYFAEPVQ